MSTPFEIEILEQGWLVSSQSEYDLCSHGRLRLIIGGQVISAGEEEYGISESALALLRTLNSHHSATAPVADRLIFHGCGTLLMMGCPIGITWNVTHTLEGVQLDTVLRFDTTDDDHPVGFNGLQALVPTETYRRQIIAFALKAKAFFQASSPRCYYDKADQLQAERFWKEYDALLGQFSFSLI